MTSNPAWRGTHRLRVTLELGGKEARVSGLQSLAGPAVQRESLDGTHIAEVSVGGTLQLLHSFDDPLLLRGSSRRDQPGHSYGKVDHALVHIDVPLSAEAPPRDILIRLLDLSGLANRPTDVDGMSRLLKKIPRTVRRVARLTTEELSAHPDWSSTGLSGSSTETVGGTFEIYVDRAGMYRWRSRRDDGEIIADSGQGYRDRSACEADLRWLKIHARDAETRSLDLK